MRKKFKTSQEGIDFFNEFTLWGKAAQMSNYYYNKLDKLGELDCNGKYKKKNEIIWDMFGDWEEVISEIDCNLHSLRWCVDLQTEQDKVDYLNEMLEWYQWYIEY